MPATGDSPPPTLSGRRRRRLSARPMKSRRKHSINYEVADDAILHLYDTHDNYVLDVDAPRPLFSPAAPVPSSSDDEDDEDAASSHYRLASEASVASEPPPPSPAHRPRSATTTAASVSSASGVDPRLHTSWMHSSPLSHRSPKSLYELSLDATCRSLPYMDGSLPAGLPREIACAIVHSLQRHGAINSNTLSKLRHCEDVGTLSLSNSRGVGDAWVRVLMEHEGHEEDPEEEEPVGSNWQGYGDDTKMTSAHDHLSKKEDIDRDPNTPTLAILHLLPQQNISIVPYPNEASRMDPPQDPNNDNTKDDCEDIFHDTNHTIEDMVQKKLLPSHESLLPTPLPRRVPRLMSNLRTLDLRSSARLTDRGLLRLPPLPNLSVARLDDCINISGRGLLFLRRSKNLTSLSLTHCRHLTDEGLVNLSAAGESLASLAVGGCRLLTDAGVGALATCVNIQRLDLSQCDLVTDAGLDALVNMSKLRELNLGWCRSVTDRGVEKVCRHPGRDETLKALTLARCGVTDGALGHLARLRALIELDLNGCARVGSQALGEALDKGMGNLRSLDVSYCPGIIRASWQHKIPTLRSLDLKYSSVRDSHLTHFTSLPCLEDLNLDSCPISDWSLAHLASGIAPRLRSLDLADTDISDAGLAYVGNFCHLAHLSLFYCNITNAGLRHLENLTTLETLNLDSRDIGDEGLVHLHRLSNLRSLDLFSGRITDIGCGYLSRLSSLESLELCGGGVGDRGCARLADMSSLTSLNLSQNERITNQGAAALAAPGRLPRMRALNLSHTGVDVRAVRCLGGMVGLQSLALYGCQGLDDRSAEVLRSKLPTLKCLRTHGMAKKGGPMGRQEVPARGWLRRVNLRMTAVANITNPDGNLPGHVLTLDESESQESNSSSGGSSEDGDEDDVDDQDVADTDDNDNNDSGTGADEGLQEEDEDDSRYVEDHDNINTDF